MGHSRLGFGRGRHHPADVVVDLIGVEILVRIHPRARFDARDLQPRASQRKHRDAAGGSQADHRDVDGLEIVAILRSVRRDAVGFDTLVEALIFGGHCGTRTG